MQRAKVQSLAPASLRPWSSSVLKSVLMTSSHICGAAGGTGEPPTPSKKALLPPTTPSKKALAAAATSPPDRTSSILRRSSGGPSPTMERSMSSISSSTWLMGDGRDERSARAMKESRPLKELAQDGEHFPAAHARHHARYDNSARTTSGKETCLSSCNAPTWTSTPLRTPSFPRVDTQEGCRLHDPSRSRRLRWPRRRHHHHSTSSRSNVPRASTRATKSP